MMLCEEDMMREGAKDVCQPVCYWNGEWAWMAWCLGSCILLTGIMGEVSTLVLEIKVVGLGIL